MFSCIGAEGSKGSLFRNGWFQCFSVKELKVPMVPYLEMGVSHVFLFKNRPKVPYSEMCGSNVFLFRN